METAFREEEETETGRALPAVTPTLEEFVGLPARDVAIVSAEVSSDLETPVSAFMKLRGACPCFLLESAESEEMWGRYSFLGFEPLATASVEGGALIVDTASGRRQAAGDPVKALFEIIEKTRASVPADGMPFSGGAVGYFGYGVLPCLEKVDLAKDPGIDGIPPMAFMFPGKLVMFDHLRSRMRLCAVVEPGETGAEREAAYRRAVGTIEEMASGLEGRLPQGIGLPLDETGGGADYDGVASNTSRERYESMVAAAREHIHAGEAIQVVVSQRFSMDLEGDPLSVYRYLRAENPSPYMFYLELPGVTLVGSSPEPMVTNRAGRAVIRPIAGTRPRGRDATEDAALAAELEDDEKERAEHIMLVDLARNDLGRVSVPGTVRVSSLMEVEKYSHVMHMVSEVEGALDPALGNYELLKASFPAGTVVGAPKVRAAEIVEELEPDGRGPYAGAVGYVSYTGDMDTCIAIRTVVVKDGTASVQAGAGIVADSVPAAEYEETRNKARALLRAVGSAGRAGL